MLRSMSDLKNYTISATDGVIGHVKDFYFDDETWVIRYLIVDTGTFLSSRKVLISPVAIGQPNWTERILPVSITKEQVRDSPDIDTEKPVSRQYEKMSLGYYGYPYYWGGTGLWGNGAYPGMMITDYFVSPPSAPQLDTKLVHERAEATRHQDDNIHLRSCKAVVSYHIQADDGDIGHVQGMLVDDETWAVRYLIVNTSNWWLGHEVLIAPKWIKDVSWSDAAVSIILTRQEVKDAPPYDSAAEFDRKQETVLHEHYGRPGYWLS